MLTKESKTVLYHLYKEYCLRRTNGLSRNDSKELGSSESVQKSVSDVDDCMCELGQNGYLDNHHASNIIYCSSLTNKAIVTMENQKKETLLNVVNFLAQFIP